ncbi:MAG: flagellar biosynthetic protein FliR [Candidatus Poribacteria bacterium]|nr:MAG: flagellar biosynthetic protein FliR [Candidatus Poribacteria bacterium]
MNPFDIGTIAAFLLVLFRLTGLLLTAPFYGVMNIPSRAKVGLALLLSVLVFPLLPSPRLLVPENAVVYAVLIFRELLVGMVIGFAAQAVFAGVQLAGQMISYQMGLALATAFDPTSGIQNTVLALLYQWMALMVFLAVDGHHFLLRGIVESYQLIGLGTAAFTGGTLQLLLAMLGELFRIAIQVSAPATVVLFFTNTLLAILGRAIPQMHVFLVGLPLTLGLGILALMLSTDSVVGLMPTLFYRLRESIFLLLETMAPR